MVGWLPFFAVLSFQLKSSLSGDCLPPPAESVLTRHLDLSSCVGNLFINKCRFDSISAKRQKDKSVALYFGTSNSVTISDSTFIGLTGIGLFAIAVEAVLQLVIERTKFMFLIGVGILGCVIESEDREQAWLSDLTLLSIMFPDGSLIESFFNQNHFDGITAQDTQVAFFVTFERDDDHLRIVRRLKCEGLLGIS
jgi:hypothetical protein